MRQFPFARPCTLSNKASDFTGASPNDLLQSLWTSLLTSRIGTNRKDLNAQGELFRACSLRWTRLFGQNQGGVK